METIEPIDREIKLVRQYFADNSTLGCLYYGENNRQVLYTLEPDYERFSMRGNAVKPGRYQVVKHYSNLHKCDVPRLIGTGRDIEIYIGNEAADTQGNILLGCSYEIRPESQKVLLSTKAFKKFMEWITNEWEQGNEVWLTIH